MHIGGRGCYCCECQGIMCLVSHPGHSHIADRAADMNHLTLSIVATSTRRERELWSMIENLQDALHKYEWVRRLPDNKWACILCGGVSITDGGDDHRDGCEWSRLMLLNQSDFEASMRGEVASPDAPQTEPERKEQ